MSLLAQPPEHVSGEELCPACSLPEGQVCGNRLDGAHHSHSLDGRPRADQSLL